MGLDMYVHKVDRKFVKSPLSYDWEAAREAKNGREEIMYWRKHPNLHGWFEQLYFEKGGTEEFNCNEVELTLDDLDRLEADIKNYKLPYTRGFFFGDFEPDEESNKEDLEFIENARKVINDGYAVFYYGWW